MLVVMACPHATKLCTLHSGMPLQQINNIGQTLCSTCVCMSQVGTADDLDPSEWQVPPHCIPIHANVTTFDWSKLYQVHTVQHTVPQLCMNAGQRAGHIVLQQKMRGSFCLPWYSACNACKLCLQLMAAVAAIVHALRMPHQAPGREW